MLSVSVGEAKNRLPYFLHLVEEENEEIQITRHGKPVAFINGKDSLQKLEKKQKYLVKTVELIVLTILSASTKWFK